MPFIYKITNMITGKMYVGKTMFSIEKRWKEHCHDCHHHQREKRPLYDAMNKYGADNFVIEPLEECAPEILTEREEYWIHKLGTFKDGYNATMGGDSKHYIDYETVIEVYCLTDNAMITAEILSIDDSHCRSILRMYGLYNAQTPEKRGQSFGKPINMFTTDGEYIRTFNSAQEAARFVLPNMNCNSVHRHASAIADVCKGRRIAAHGYKWEYMIPEDDK